MTADCFWLSIKLYFISLAAKFALKPKAESRQPGLTRTHMPPSKQFYQTDFLSIKHEWMNDPLAVQNGMDDADADDGSRWNAYGRCNIERIEEHVPLLLLNLRRHSEKETRTTNLVFGEVDCQAQAEAVSSTLHINAALSQMQITFKECSTGVNEDYYHTACATINTKVRLKTNSISKKKSEFNVKNHTFHVVYAINIFIWILLKCVTDTAVGLPGGGRRHWATHRFSWNKKWPWTRRLRNPFSISQCVENEVP